MAVTSLWHCLLVLPSHARPLFLMITLSSPMLIPHTQPTQRGTRSTTAAGEMEGARRLRSFSSDAIEGTTDVIEDMSTLPHKSLPSVQLRQQQKERSQQGTRKGKGQGSSASAPSAGRQEGGWPSEVSDWE